MKEKKIAQVKYINQRIIAFSGDKNFKDLKVEIQSVLDKHVSQFGAVETSKLKQTLLQKVNANLMIFSDKFEVKGDETNKWVNYP